KMNRFSVTLDELDRFPHFRLLRFRFSDPQHLFVEIEPDRLDAAASQTKGDITRTAADIERRLARLWNRKLDHAPFPITVQTKALQIIHQVITPRDKREQFLHLLRPLLAWNEKLLCHE